MKIFIDENIPRMTVEELKSLEHDVRDIRGTKDEGMDDEKLWDLVQQENRLLITTDKSFAKYREDVHAGVLIIRLKQPNRNKIHKRVMFALNHFKQNKWR